jgi:hypothetical protein
MLEVRCWKFDVQRDEHRTFNVQRRTSNEGCPGTMHRPPAPDSRSFGANTFAPNPVSTHPCATSASTAGLDLERVWKMDSG